MKGTPSDIKLWRHVNCDCSNYSQSMSFFKVINSIAQDTLNIINYQRNEYNHALNYVDKDRMHE